jgi:hypothetical protein
MNSSLLIFTLTLNSVFLFRKLSTFDLAFDTLGLFYAQLIQNRPFADAL